MVYNFIMKSIDLKILEKYVEEGKLRKSEDKELVQYNYSDYITDDFWDDVTRNNRGHIYEKTTGKLVARTFEKFFNFNELSLDKQQDLLKNNDFTVSKKYDGCLGIIYKYNNELRCNSRGSFDNYVVKAMKRIIASKRIEEEILDLPYNLVVEVISHETKIVLDYDFEDLVLLTAYSYNNFNEASIADADDIAKKLNLKRPEQYKMTYDELFKWQKEHDWTEEGFVLRYSDNYRVKMKSEDYMRISALKANLNGRHIWDILKNNHSNYRDTMKEIMKDTPDEFQKEVELIVKGFENKMAEHKIEIDNLYKTLSHKSDKEVGLYFKDNKSIYAPIIFNMRKGKSISEELIKLVKPVMP